MQDFVPLGTGNSRSLKSAVPAGTTWEQALAMLRNGTFPIDIGAVNEAGVSQKGTPLNRSTLLSAETEALYPGLPENLVPDDVFAFLSTAKKYKVVNSGDFSYSQAIVFNLNDVSLKNKNLKLFIVPKVYRSTTVEVALYGAKTVSSSRFFAGQNAFVNNDSTIQVDYGIIEVHPYFNEENILSQVSMMHFNRGFWLQAAHKNPEIENSPMIRCTVPFDTSNTAIFAAILCISEDGDTYAG